ncbi:uncharacterized protein LOC114186698 [Vigna unguiculata]|uniref:uncharacterized protein LOC114186698 n=1 Tax=Vigna unguiculata TaxID=3917 RepID=UPI001015F5CC|nr:uncharacterized protein LOC114186698 [Vigna unguiculata]
MCFCVSFSCYFSFLFSILTTYMEQIIVSVNGLFREGKMVKKLDMISDIDDKRETLKVAIRIKDLCLTLGSYGTTWFQLCCFYWMLATVLKKQFSWSMVLR